MGPLFPRYDHEFGESAANMEFMLHVQATVFYHRDIIGTKSTIQVWGRDEGMRISKRYRPWADINVCRIRCSTVEAQ
jgi:hypothetical protein